MPSYMWCLHLEVCHLHIALLCYIFVFSFYGWYRGEGYEGEGYIMVKEQKQTNGDIQALIT